MDITNCKPNQFSLRTLFAITTLCPIGALIGPATIEWLYTPEPVRSDKPSISDVEFRRLMTLIEQSPQQPHTTSDDTGIVITHGPGLSIP
jgi:hypothetical protein